MIVVLLVHCPELLVAIRATTKLWTANRRRRSARAASLLQQQQWDKRAGVCLCSRSAIMKLGQWTPGAEERSSYTFPLLPELLWFLLQCPLCCSLLAGSFIRAQCSTSTAAWPVGISNTTLFGPSRSSSFPIPDPLCAFLSTIAFPRPQSRV